MCIFFLHLNREKSYTVVAGVKVLIGMSDGFDSHTRCTQSCYNDKGRRVQMGREYASTLTLGEIAGKGDEWVVSLALVDLRHFQLDIISYLTGIKLNYVSELPEGLP
jgi:hypothetical protein